MTPLPYVNSGAKIAFYAVIVTFALAEARVRHRSRLNHQGSASDRHSRLLVWVTVLVGMIGAFSVATRVGGAAIRGGRWPIFVVGLVLMGAGIVIRQWAVALLGHLFTTDVRIHADQKVVDTGPYRWVRHPSYTGMLLTFVGLGLALGNWAALAVLVAVPTVGLVVRIRVEETALVDGLGDPYRRFAASRARLVPGLW